MTSETQQDEGLVPELGDWVEVENVPDFLGYPQTIEAEVLQVFKNGKLKICDPDGKVHHVDRSQCCVLRKAA